MSLKLNGDVIWITFKRYLHGWCVQNGLGWREEAADIQETWWKARAGVQQRDKDGSGPSKAGSWQRGGAQGKGREQG